ncbi:hypothetical protein [Streptomyces lavendofoliae]|uniref:Secreted protein n=1 Tax=Streptomyces lavendofoliae TaxID=67314 RepID=A0A918HWU3_9ACTN|nr:hypothetical protein [Streptomyces lavendofoliae]GGU32631.1 hypothetical protein GCM10010274_19540 [Streptomyces lavendofoliae]
MTRTTRLLAVAVIAAVVAAGTATIAAAGRADTAPVPAPAALGGMTTLGDNHLPAPPRG